MPLTVVPLLSLSTPSLSLSVDTGDEPSHRLATPPPQRRRSPPHPSYHIPTESVHPISHN
ncbi:hypothetical protein Hanom_Chr11g01039961 [Helianthus anomalus]